MARVAITDLDDPRIAIYRSLKATNHTRGLDQFVVEGEKLVGRLLASRFPTVSVLVTDRYLPTLAGRLPEEMPTYVVADAMVDSIVGFPFHRGVLACGERNAWPSLDEIVERAGDRLTLVLCPRLSNPENLGAIRGSATSSVSTRFWQAHHARTRCCAGCSESRWDPA